RNFLLHLGAQNLDCIRTLLALLSTPPLNSLFLIASTAQAPAVQIIQTVFAAERGLSKHTPAFVVHNATPQLAIAFDLAFHRCNAVERLSDNVICLGGCS